MHPQTRERRGKGWGGEKARRPAETDRQAERDRDVLMKHIIVGYCIVIILSGLQERMKVQHEHIMTRMTEHTHTQTCTHTHMHISTLSLSLSPSLRKRIMQPIVDGYDGHVDCELRGH